jgi:hypothetical protein
MSAQCPACGYALDPAPKRSKACPSCRRVFYVRGGIPVSRSDAIKWDDERGILASLLTPAERCHRIRIRLKERKEKNVRQLNSLKSMRDCFTHVYITATHDSRCCDFCRTQDEREIPVKDCTSAMLPPFSECKNKDDGCRCHFIALTPEMYARRHGLPEPPMSALSGVLDGLLDDATLRGIVRNLLGIKSPPIATEKPPE